MPGILAFMNSAILALRRTQNARQNLDLEGRTRLHEGRKLLRMINRLGLKKLGAGFHLHFKLGQHRA